MSSLTFPIFMNPTFQMKFFNFFYFSKEKDIRIYYGMRLRYGPWIFEDRKNESFSGSMVITRFYENSIYLNCGNNSKNYKIKENEF